MLYLSKPCTILFIGIGGIGMSALAIYFKEKGFDIKGYDKTCTNLTLKLENLGIRIQYETNFDLLSSTDLVIYTPAVGENDVLLTKARELQLPCYKRSTILGEISKNQFTIAVAGTHGKTTTSAMITHLLRSNEIDCSAFVGGIMKNYDSNFLSGKSEIVVIEADEYDRSFLSLCPNIAIITSLDPDHLDIYGNADTMTQNYIEFAHKIKDSGTLIIQNKIKPYINAIDNTKISFYGDLNNNYHSKITKIEGLTTYFDYNSPNRIISNLRLQMPGAHNVMNMTAAITVAIELRLNDEQIKNGVESFLGIWRRFEIHINTDMLTYIDDYAHHPEEIRAAISAAKELFPTKKIVVAFQPHLFSRTKDFNIGFAETLSLANEVYLLPIYPAREKPIQGVTSNIIGNKITSKLYYTNLDKMTDDLLKECKEPTVILTLGAGDIDTKVLPTKLAIMQKFHN